MRIGEENTTKRKKVTITSSKKEKTKQKNKQKKAADLRAGCLSGIQDNDNTEPGA